MAQSIEEKRAKAAERKARSRAGVGATPPAAETDLVADLMAIIHRLMLQNQELVGALLSVTMRDQKRDQNGHAVTESVTESVTAAVRHVEGGLGGGLSLGSQSSLNKSKLLGSEIQRDLDQDPARASACHAVTQGVTKRDMQPVTQSVTPSHASEPGSGVRVTILEKAKERPIHDEQHRASALRQQQELARLAERGGLK